jgi:citrate lyase subunit beta/citryl-CoA lyase
MAILVRRSNLMVPVTDADKVAQAWRHTADAVTLDLENRAAAGKAHARDGLKDAIASSGRGAAEVFVRVNKSSLHADLEASVWPGVSGIMLPQVDSAAEVTDAADVVARLERERGLGVGSHSFIVLLGSARGVWDIRAIITASARISQVGLDENDLAQDLGIDPAPEYDPFVYARGRLAVEATAAKVSAIGMAYPLGALPCEMPEPDIQSLATKARNLGMKGVICPYASWVAPVNAAFTPTADLVAWNRRVREAFAAGVAAGTAAVPLDGKMIDVPVDEWAIVVLAMAEACAARDAEKRAALNRQSAA